MTLRWTSEVPPAMLAALLHNHWRCQKPHIGASAPRTESAADDKSCVMCDQVSLTQLDSGPGAMPLASFERVRQLWVLNTTRETYASTSASAHRGIVERAACGGLCEELRQIALVDDLFLEGEVRAALVREGRRRNRPSGVLLTDALVVGTEDLVQEDLVEFGVACHLNEGPDVDTRCLHVERQQA